MNPSTSYSSASPAEGAANLLRDLVSAMPIVILYKAVRTALAKH